MKQESPAVWVCPQCGAFIPQESENCPRCGLSYPDPTTASACDKPRDKSYLFISEVLLNAGCLGAAVLLVCGIIMLFRWPWGLFEGGMLLAAGLVVLFAALSARAAMSILRSIDRSLKEMNGMFK